MAPAGNSAGARRAAAVADTAIGFGRVMRVRAFRRDRTALLADEVARFVRAPAAPIRRRLWVRTQRPRAHDLPVLDA
jgi:hypothetical protein